MRVRRVAGVDQADAIRIIDRAPTTVVEHISLPSAEKAVAALTAAGAVARLELEQNWSQAAPSP
jgi:ribosomal protein L7/L12